MFVSKYTKLALPIINIANIFEVIPSLALLAILIPVFGIGKPPAIVALFIYSLLPIIRNTYVGLTNVDLSLIEAARGMGMTEIQILRKVKFPIALPIIMAGIRTAGVLLIGVAVIVSLIGAGGLGELLFLGITTMNNELILMGAISASLLSIAVEVALEIFEKALTPKGLKIK